MLSKGRNFCKNTKKLFLLFIFFMLSIISSHATDFPQRISENSIISILAVNYTDLPHSLFSKSCMRIYDKENNFDQIIDFAHFEDFDDNFFLLKFFFNEKKAKIITEPFLDYFLAQKKRTNVSLIEFKLDLSPEEIAYIFNFISILHKAIPNYSYDFDILENNSESHISQILHDSNRMASKNQSTEKYSISNIMQHKLNYKKINDSYVLLSEKEKINLQEQILTESINSTPKSLIIILAAISSLIFLLTSYQMLVCFFQRIYIHAIFSTTQILDFLILFISGLLGTVILLQDFLSNQSLFQNNFQFLFLFPLNFIAAFTIFKPIKNTKIVLTYWSTVLGCIFLYLIVFAIIRKLSIVSFLLTLIIFFRISYFTFVSILPKLKLQKNKI